MKNGLARETLKAVSIYLGVAFSINNKPFPNCLFCVLDFLGRNCVWRYLYRKIKLWSSKVIFQN